MVYIANHPETNKTPIEAAVQRRQSHPIIANVPIYNYKRGKRVISIPPLAAITLRSPYIDLLLHYAAKHGYALMHRRFRN
jgi:hypothetical protein